MIFKIKISRHLPHFGKKTKLNSLFSSYHPILVLLHEPLLGDVLILNPQRLKELPPDLLPGPAHLRFRLRPPSFSFPSSTA